MQGFPKNKKKGNTVQVVLQLWSASLIFFSFIVYFKDQSRRKRENAARDWDEDVAAQNVLSAFYMHKNFPLCYPATDGKMISVSCLTFVV